MTGETVLVRLTRDPPANAVGLLPALATRPQGKGICDSGVGVSLQSGNGRLAYSVALRRGYDRQKLLRTT